MQTAATSFKTLTSFFKGSSHAVTDESKTVMLSCHLVSAVCLCSLSVKEEPLLTCEIMFPVLVHNQKFTPFISELIERLNADDSCGVFSLDSASGEISYSASIEVPSTGLNGDHIKALFMHASNTFTLFFPAFMGVMYGGCTPEDAYFLIQVEGSKP